MCNLYVCCDLLPVSSEGHFIKWLLTKQGCHLPQEYGPQTIPDSAELVFVQPPVYKISLHIWMTSGTTWWSGVPGRERLTRQHPLKITSQRSACETSWVNMPLPLEYLNLQVTVSIKKHLFETVSSKIVILQHLSWYDWCINVEWIHKPLYVEIKAVFVYINNTPANRGLFH